ncbi:MAG: T9SS type B sorting domain-containing protein, partial [Flavobacteriaceae bacterium]|nr:T9SS type B sorting domain-containing protein [Flavobacteriaceae bacterium]
MKKITLLIFAFLTLCFSVSAQYSFPTIAGPTNVAAGSPVTLSINDAGNSEAVPVSSTGTYSSFSVSADWAAGGGGPWSSEAGLNLNTSAGSVNIPTATSGSGTNGNATTLVFEGDFSGPYDPAVNGFLEIILSQSWGGSDADWSNIVVTIFESPTCFEPFGLSTNNILATSVDVSWTSSGSETDWEVVVQPAGTGEPSGSGSAASTNPYTFSGLTAATDYEVYVRANCLSDGFSTWAGPINFTTACDVFIPEYLEDFTTIIPNCWDEASNGDGVTGPTDLGAGSWTSDGYLNNGFSGAYKINLYASSKSDWILSPQIDLTGGPFQVEFDFGIMEWLSSTTAGTLGSDDTVELYITTDNWATWTNLLTIDNTFVVPATGTQIVYNLSAYSGEIVQFGILGSEGTVDDSADNDVFVDNFRVREIPSCNEPNGMMHANTSADSTDLNWNAGNTETNWNLEINPDADFTPGNSEASITDTATGTPNYTVSGLMIDTTYYIYYQADCGGSGTSAWVGPYTFLNGYCESDPSSNDGSGISEIVLGSTTFTSGGDLTYENFTATSVDVPELITVNLQITFAHTFTYGTNVWIDLNNDLVFDNTTELVFQGNSSGGTNPHVLDASFVMPSTSYGIYRMRIGSADFGQSTPNPCYNGSWGVTADFSINVVAPPSCIPPSFLTVSNIDGTSADISWTANNGETAWEYVVQLAGTGEPSGTGVSSATNSLTESGLDYSTDYELYVRSDCGGGDLSTWSGPVNFTTTIQTFYDIVCDTDSPININYCYDNNDTTAWTFNSDNGFPIELVFNSGTIEGFWDDITIYDGSDNTAPVLFNNNDNDQDDLAGLVIETTGTSLYIEIDSDSSASCQSSSFYTPWDFDVICKTCLDPEATFTVIGDCDTTQEFTVDVDITDMGTATSLIVSDGTSNQTVTSTGVVTFGPYPEQTPTIITITNADDTSCEISSSVLNLICPPPPNPCSIIYAGEDTSVCEGASINLSADFQVLGQDLNTYEINALDTCPQPPASGGEPTSVEIDDRWSGVIDLGFDFCFFAGTYNQILIGSNGVVSFDLSNADGFNGWNIDPGDTLPNNTNSSLADANIFGVAHDIDPSVCGDINYYLLGSAPSRQFVINYTDICHFSCNELTSSTQIILYESSNTIDVNIFNKPTCETWNDGNAVVGVQNPAGTVAFTPPGRNTGVWEATDEFWRFTPSTGAPNYVLEWYDGDTLVGTGDTVNVSPTETTTYTAAITYNLCTGESATVTDDVTIEIFDNPEPVAVQDTIIICEGIETTLEVNVENSDIPDTIVYYWTYDGVDVQSGPENTYTIPEGTSQFGDFIVTAIDGNGCFGDTIISVVQGEYPAVSPVEPVINKCINEEAILEVVVSNLSVLYGNVIYDWYLDGTLLQSGTDNTYIHGIGAQEGLVTVDVYDDVTQCLSETQITVSYYENANCVDIPQGLSPNNDGYNDCLILDHLDDRDDISKAIVFNRYGTKVYELNNYVDQWCGTNQDGEVLPVGTYYYIIYFNSDRKPITSWIY